MGSGGGLRRERQGRTSHGLQSLATAERRKASTVLYCLSLHTSYPTPAGDPGAHPNWRPTRTGQLGMRSHACPCLLSMFTWLKFAAFEKVFLRVAPCRILREPSQASGRHSHLLQPKQAHLEKDNVGVTGLPGRIQNSSGRATFVPEGLVSCV